MEHFAIMPPWITCLKGAGSSPNHHELSYSCLWHGPWWTSRVPSLGNYFVWQDDIEWRPHALILKLDRGTWSAVSVAKVSRAKASLGFSSQNWFPPTSGRNPLIFWVALVRWFRPRLGLKEDGMMTKINAAFCGNPLQKPMPNFSSSDAEKCAFCCRIATTLT